jgi:ornithine cyclodeaminase
MRILRAAEILSVLSPEMMIDAMEQAVRMRELDKFRAPSRCHLAAGPSTWLVMPASDGAHVSVKVVSVDAARASAGVPTTRGLLLLLEAGSGAALALIDGTALTAERTGAISALALRHLALAGARLGVIGAGVQAASQIVYAARIIEVDRVRVFARREQAFRRLAENVQRRAKRIVLEPCASAWDVLAQSDVVIAATSSLEPVLPDRPELVKGKLLISVGSFRPDMQELPDSAYRLARCVIVDSPSAIDEAGDLISALSSGLIERTSVYGLDALLGGCVPLQPTRIFKSVGHAAFDLCAADLLYRAAGAAGIGEVIEL